MHALPFFFVQNRAFRLKKSHKNRKIFLAFLRRHGIIADGNALHDEGVIIHEEKYSSVLRRSGRALCLRRDLPYRLHQGRAEGRNLQQVPPVLHGPSEAGRQRRTSRSLQEALRSVRKTLNSDKTQSRICGSVFVLLFRRIWTILET